MKNIDTLVLVTSYLVKACSNTLNTKEPVIDFIFSERLLEMESLYSSEGRELYGCEVSFLFRLFYFLLLSETNGRSSFRSQSFNESTLVTKLSCAERFQPSRDLCVLVNLRSSFSLHRVLRLCCLKLCGNCMHYIV